MAIREYWVDPELGSNSNSGTRAAPFLDIRHATSTAITSAQGVNDTVIVNVVPCKLLDGVEQYIRLDAADWTGGRLVVRSAVPGLPWIVGAGGSRLIWAVGACNATVEIYDCTATTVRILEWAGLTTPSATGIRLIVDGSCQFTQNTNSGSGDCFNFDSDASESSLTIRPGARIRRWASLCFGTFLRSVSIDGLDFDSLDGLSRTTNIFSDSLTIKNSTFKWSASLNHVFVTQCRSADFVIENNSFDMLSTNGATSFWFDAPPVGVTGVKCSITGNSFLVTSPAPAVHVGNVLVDSSSRAANDATRSQFLSCLISDNDIVQRNADGGGLRVMIGTTGAVVARNYVRASNLADASNVHVCYLYGSGIQLRDNFVQGSVLVFGPDQKIFNNIVIAKQNALLLGGTQGGSQPVGGGNNYTIGGNILASIGAACLNDYAYNGAYPDNLGDLVCECNNNVYIPLSGATAAAQLTDAGLLATTIEQIRNVWNNSALSGSGSVWGASTNAGNDSYSRVASGAELSWYQYLRDSVSGVMLRSDFEVIRNSMGSWDVIGEPESVTAGTGTGARTVVVTVLLSGSPVEGAQVRLTKGAETYIGSTDSSGLVTFNVNDGTWVVSITSPGAYFTGASLVVDGAESVSYSLTGGSAIVPSEPGFVTGYWLCLSPSGVPEAGVTVSMQVSALPSGSVGLALDNTIRGATSGVDGVAQFDNLIPGVRYAIWRGAGDKYYVVIPSNATSPLELSSIIGNP